MSKLKTTVDISNTQLITNFHKYFFFITYTKMEMFGYSYLLYTYSRKFFVPISPMNGGLVKCLSRNPNFYFKPRKKNKIILDSQNIDNG